MKPRQPGKDFHLPEIKTLNLKEVRERYPTASKEFFSSQFNRNACLPHALPFAFSTATRSIAKRPGPRRNEFGRYLTYRSRRATYAGPSSKRGFSTYRDPFSLSLSLSLFFVSLSLSLCLFLPYLHPFHLHIALPPGNLMPNSKRRELVCRCSSQR
eukprot:TRINITY_DN12759_c0_g1_i1.p1 TRINITY_DN12759_c0_g1~~TRINITY_DN12759_c0_g1_i1.p1  ORF type:complete len:156 (+),score=29.20 TRINITY_DN12759_c0_g1_i1:341-808(+)